jgi:hypothetical protein
LRSEKDRLKDGAAMFPCGGLAYMADCGGEPAGNEEDSDGRATCILRRPVVVGSVRRACALRGEGWRTAVNGAHWERSEDVV